MSGLLELIAQVFVTSTLAYGVIYSLLKAIRYVRQMRAKSRYYRAAR